MLCDELLRETTQSLWLNNNRPFVTFNQFLDLHSMHFAEEHHILLVASRRKPFILDCFSYLGLDASPHKSSSLLSDFWYISKLCCKMIASSSQKLRCQTLSSGTRDTIVLISFPVRIAFCFSPYIEYAVNSVN